jgi:hypothetical protein
MIRATTYSFLAILLLKGRHFWPFLIEKLEVENI